MEERDRNKEEEEKHMKKRVQRNIREENKERDKKSYEEGKRKNGDRILEEEEKQEKESLPQYKRKEYKTYERERGKGLGVERKKMRKIREIKVEEEKKHTKKRFSWSIRKEGDGEKEEME